jgi:site-specific DNA-methyltransferase (adenine-specific)
MLENKRYELLIGDCLEIMDSLIERGIKVDSVICDIPYGTISCAWDQIIPFDEMWDKLYELTKDSAPIVLFSSQPFTTKLINSNIKNFREEIIWLKNKSASGMQAKQKHLKVHENIIVFSKKGSYTFNPQKWEVKEKEFLTQRKTMSIYGESNNVYGNLKRKRKPDDGTRNPISIIAYKVPITPAKTKTYSEDVDLRCHPTQKSKLLMDYLVKTFSNENDIVLDFTMGVGTTGVACMENKRRFIGIEIEEEYFNIAKKRIEENLA